MEISILIAELLIIANIVKGVCLLTRKKLPILTPIRLKDFSSLLTSFPGILFNNRYAWSLPLSLWTPEQNFDIKAKLLTNKARQPPLRPVITTFFKLNSLTRTKVDATEETANVVLYRLKTSCPTVWLYIIDRTCNLECALNIFLKAFSFTLLVERKDSRVFLLKTICCHFYHNLQ